jgi:hypothetical protein
LSTIAVHPSESGHWYTKAGEPAYQVPSADGKKFVTPDVRHARKLGLVPSVTTIIREAAKPGLERWKIEQGILAALTLPKKPGEMDVDYISRILRDSQEQARKAADRGTLIHAAIQRHYEGGGADSETWTYVKATVTAIREKYGAQPWKCEQSFSHPLGFGGKTDIHADAVLDVKSKEFDGPIKKLAWDEHCIQLAAYREGLGLPKAPCANVFVSVNNPGLVHIHEWTEDELQRGWKMFNALLDYWYARTGCLR